MRIYLKHIDGMYHSSFEYSKDAEKKHMNKVIENLILSHFGKDIGKNELLESFVIPVKNNDEFISIIIPNDLIITILRVFENNNSDIKLKLIDKDNKIINEAFKLIPCDTEKNLNKLKEFLKRIEEADININLPSLNEVLEYIEDKNIFNLVYDITNYQIIKEKFIDLRPYAEASIKQLDIEIPVLKAENSKEFFVTILDIERLNTLIEKFNDIKNSIKSIQTIIDKKINEKITISNGISLINDFKRERSILKHEIEQLKDLMELQKYTIETICEKRKLELKLEMLDRYMIIAHNN